MKDPDADLPPYKIRHNDMKLQNIKLIVRSNYYPTQRPHSSSKNNSRSHSQCWKKIFALNLFNILKRIRLILELEKVSGNVSSEKILQLVLTMTFTNLPFWTYLNMDIQFLSSNRGDRLYPKIYYFLLTLKTL